MNHNQTKEADGTYTCMFIKNCPNGVDYLLPMLNLTDDSERKIVQNYSDLTDIL